jgi:hypothetical protein
MMQEILENYKGVVESLSYRAIGSQAQADAAVVPFDPAVRIRYLLDLSSISRTLIQLPGRSITLLIALLRWSTGDLHTHTYSSSSTKHQDSGKAQATEPHICIT